MWKKGQSGNISGRPKLDINDKRVKKIVKNEINRIAEMTFGMSVEDLKRQLKDKDKMTTAAQLLLSQISKGNLRALELLIERVLGRPAQYIEATGDGEQMPVFTIVPYKEREEDEEESDGEPSNE